MANGPPPPCLHPLLLPNSPRPGLSECDECGHQQNAAGDEVAPCFDCGNYDLLIDLFVGDDPFLRCDDCNCERQRAVGRRRAEDERDSAYEAALP